MFSDFLPYIFDRLYDLAVAIFAWTVSFFIDLGLTFILS